MDQILVSSRFPTVKKKAFWEQKAADGGIFLFKDGVCLSCHRPKTSLCFRQSTAGVSSFLPPFSKSGRLMYVGRWSFDHISSEILSVLLITNCFKLNTQDKPLLHPLSKPNLLPAPLSFNQYFLFFFFFTGCLSSSSQLSSSLSSNFKRPLSFFRYTADRGKKKNEVKE